MGRDGQEGRAGTYPPPLPTMKHNLTKQLEWIDENEVDEIDTDQYNLLGQVWHGQKQLVGQTDFLEDGLYCEYAYFVDFEKKVLEVEGVLENTLIIAFKDLKEGVIDKMKALSEGEEKGEEQKDGEMNWKSAKMAKAFDDSMKAMGYSCSSGGAASQGGK